MIDEKKIEEAQEAFFEEEVYGKGEDITYNDLEGNFMCTEERYGDEHIKIAFEAGVLWTQEYFAKTLWHDASEEPNTSRDAWLIMQTGGDLYEVVKYGGYNEDGGQTWQQQAKKGNIIRWSYLDDILPKEGGSDEGV